MRTWLLGVAVLFALRLVGDFVPLMSATGWRWTTRLAELWLAGGLLVWAWRSVPNAEVAAGIGRRRLAAVGLIFLAVAAGQFVGPGSEAYPFVHWDMYTSSADQVVYGEVWLVDGTGAGRLLDISATDLATEPRAISGRLLQEAEAAADGDAAARDLLQRAIAVLAEGQAPAAEVRRCEVDRPTPEAPARCEVVITVGLEEDT